MNGTASQPFSVYNAPGSGNFGGFTNSTYHDTGAMVATYGTFTGCGTATLDCWTTYNFYYYGMASSCFHCIFVSSGQIEDTGIQAGTNASFSFKNSSCKNPINASGYCLQYGGPVGDSTFSCAVEQNYFEGTVKHVPQTSGQADGCTLKGNVFKSPTGAMALNDLGAYANGNAFGNLFYFSDQSGASGFPAGYMTQSVFLLAFNANYFGAPHLYCGGPDAQGNGASALYNGVVIERQYQDYPGSEGTSSCFYTGGGVSARYTWTLENSISIPTPDGYSPAVLINVVSGCGSTCPQIKAIHNTAIVSPTAGGGFAVFTGEGSTGASGLYSQISDNLFWQPTSGTGYGVGWFSGSVPGSGTFQNVGNNDWFNVTGSAFTSKYDAPSGAYSGTPGSYGEGDFNFNPYFVGCPYGGVKSILNCNFTTWAKTLGLTPTTWSDVMNQFRCMNDFSGCSFTPLAVASYYNFIRAGYAPTAAGLHGTASDSTDIGAVAWRGLTLPVHSAVIF
jgi:hypothetical protein